MTVTVGPGEIAQFKGLGSNLCGWGTSSGGGTGGLSYEIRKEITTIVWKDLNLQLARFYRSHLDWDINEVIDQYGDAAALVKEVQPTAKFLYNPVGLVNEDGAQWAHRIATRIKEIHDNSFFQNSGVTVYATGAANEPSNPLEPPWNNWAGIMSPSTAVDVVRNLRQELDGNGLNDIKIIGCESANVDSYSWQFVDGLKNDPEALAALDHFGFHGYDMEMIQKMYTYLQSLGITESWQTESCSDKQNEGLGDSTIAAETAVRFLCNLNFATVYWLYWNDKGRGPLTSDFSARLLNFDGSTGEYAVPLKYHYLKLLSQIFVPGSKIRKSTCDLGDRTGRSEDKYFEYTYGLKVPIGAASAVTPEQRWVIAASNITGLPGRWPHTEFYPRDTYTITFVVDELRNAGTMDFEVWRCTANQLVIMDSNPVQMVDGAITIDVKPCELVALRGPEGVTCLEPAVTSAPTNQYAAEGSQAVFTVRGTGSLLRYQWERNDGSGWLAIANATSADCYVEVAPADNGAQFRCILTGACGSPDTSAAATLFVTLLPPRGLQYPENPATYVVGKVARNNIPNVDGAVDTFFVSPILPSGLSIDGISGTISGIPTAVSASAAYTITAGNSAGTDSVVLTIEVVADTDTVPPSNDVTLQVNAASATQLYVRWTTPESSSPDAESVFVVYDVGPPPDPDNPEYAVAYGDRVGETVQQRSLVIDNLEESTTYHVGLWIADTAGNISQVVRRTAATPEFDQPINPVLVKGSFVDETRIAIEIANYAGLPLSAPNGQYYATDIGMWANAERFPVNTSENPLVRYSVAGLTTKGPSFKDTLTVTSLAGTADSAYYLIASVYWSNTTRGDTIPPFVTENGDIVHMQAAPLITNSLEITAIVYNDQNNQLTVTIGNTSAIAGTAVQMGVWYGFEDSPDFTGPGFTLWIPVDDVKSQDPYDVAVTDPLFLADSQTVYVAVALSGQSGELSEATIDSSIVGLPSAALVRLTVESITPQSVTLGWKSSDSVRIWWGTDTVPLSAGAHQRFFSLSASGADSIAFVDQLNPQTVYWFGLQAWHGGRWSTVTHESRRRVQTPALHATDTMLNHLHLVNLVFDTLTNSIRAQVHFENDLVYWRDRLQVGIAYGFTPPTLDTGLQVFNLLSPDTVIAVHLKENLAPDTTYHVALFLRSHGLPWAVPTRVSRGAVVTTAVTLHVARFFVDGASLHSAFNNTVILRENVQFGAVLEDTLKLVPIALEGADAVSGILQFTHLEHVPKVDIGISIDAGNDSARARLYRLDSLGVMEVVRDAWVEQGRIWITTTDLSRGFVVAIDTVGPGSFATVLANTSEPHVYQVRTSITDTVVLDDPVKNIRWAFFVSRDGAGSRIDLVDSGTTTSRGDSLFLTISHRDISVTSGMLALLVLNDGSIADTVDISRRVHRKNSNPAGISTAVKWYPLCASADLHATDPCVVLSSLSSLDCEGNWYTGRELRLMQWHSGQWQEYSQSNAAEFFFAPGKLMWVSVKSPAGFALGDGTTVNTGREFEMLVRAGDWLDFGLPYDIDLPVAALLDHSEPSASQLQFYTWVDSQVYSTGPVHVAGVPGLENPKAVLRNAPLGGYTVYNPTTKDVILRFPSVTRLGMWQKSTTASKQRIDNRWGLQLTAHMKNGQVSNAVAAAFDPEITATRVFPVSASFADIRLSAFIAPEGQSGHIVFGNDNQNGGELWITCDNASSTSRVATIRFTETIALPPGYYVAVQDGAGGIRVLEDGEVDLAVPGNAKIRRKVIVGTSSFIAKHGAGISRAISSARITAIHSSRQGFLDLGYELPRALVQSLRFGLYDITGRRVLSTGDIKPVGELGEFRWDMRSMKRGSLPAGAYLLRMEAQCDDRGGSAIDTRAFTIADN